MPTFTVEHQTKLAQADTFQKVCDYLQNSEGLKKLDSSLNWKFDQNTKTGHVKGSKFTCDFKVEGGEGSKVIMTVVLPMLLTPFRATVENTLKEKMSKILG